MRRGKRGGAGEGEPPAAAEQGALVQHRDRQVGSPRFAFQFPGTAGPAGGSPGQKAPVAAGTGGEGCLVLHSPPVLVLFLSDSLIRGKPCQGGKSKA